MKTAVIAQIRVEPALRADLDAVLLPGETLTDFVEASVRAAVEFRRVQPTSPHTERPEAGRRRRPPMGGQAKWPSHIYLRSPAKATVT